MPKLIWKRMRNPKVLIPLKRGGLEHPLCIVYGVKRGEYIDFIFRIYSGRIEIIKNPVYYERILVFLAALGQVGKPLPNSIQENS